MKCAGSHIRTVPEHSVAFMEAASGGKAIIRDDCLFLAGDGWLAAIGYPFSGEYGQSGFSAALADVARETGTRECWAIAPEMPQEFRAHVNEKDVYYVLPADSPVPARLRGPMRKAADILLIDETKIFTAAHRRLWAEFLRRKKLSPQVGELFARTAAILDAPGTDVRLLNAWDKAGNLTACCVMDYAPARFSSYIIGAHSREAYTPHAGDALLAAMLERARQEGKDYIHLGLGVNEGIRRFKEKWGGIKAMPYQAASWKAGEARAGSQREVPGLVRDVLYFSMTAMASGQSGGASLSLDDFGELPEQRSFAMLWELAKNGRTSWIAGTAHIFRYSFSRAFRKLFRQVDTVIFEGPLDAASLSSVARQGRTPGLGPRMADYLTEEEIRRLERIVRGPEGRLAEFLNMTWEKPADVRRILAEHRPWSAFFTLYYAFLERNGWRQSVDLEAWETAHAMGRHVTWMETIDDQLESLESVPLERILGFLRSPEAWPKRMRQSLDAYLAGDLDMMLGTSTEFPTRTERVISARDQIFLEAMRPHIEQGRTVVFVGTAHMFNLESLLREDGFAVTKVHPTLLHKLRARIKGWK
jgi:uncharacterized protein YbaP (TraB family)